MTAGRECSTSPCIEGRTVTEPPGPSSSPKLSWPRTHLISVLASGPPLELLTVMLPVACVAGVSVTGPYENEVQLPLLHVMGHVPA